MTFKKILGSTLYAASIFFIPICSFGKCIDLAGYYMNEAGNLIQVEVTVNYTDAAASGTSYTVKITKPGIFPSIEVNCKDTDKILLAQDNVTLQINPDASLQLMINVEEGEVGAKSENFHKTSKLIYNWLTNHVSLKSNKSKPIRKTKIWRTKTNPLGAKNSRASMLSNPADASLSLAAASRNRKDAPAMSSAEHSYLKSLLESSNEINNPSYSGYCFPDRSSQQPLSSIAHLTLKYPLHIVHKLQNVQSLCLLRQIHEIQQQQMQQMQQLRQEELELAANLLTEMKTQKSQEAEQEAEID